MKNKTGLRVAVEEGHLAPNHLNETHLKANLTHSEGEVGTAGEIANESVASVFRTVNYLYLHRVLNLVILMLLNDRENAVRVLALFTNYLPNGRVDGRPCQPLLHL
jgi:hypothetical protein